MSGLDPENEAHIKALAEALYDTEPRNRDRRFLEQHADVQYRWNDKASHALRMASQAIATLPQPAASAGGWDRARACEAARVASHGAGVWVPQAWLDKFMSAYEVSLSASPQPPALELEPQTSAPDENEIAFRKVGFTADAINFPLSARAHEWLCAFNGTTPDKAPWQWAYAPNAYMQKYLDERALPDQGNASAGES